MSKINLVDGTTAVIRELCRKTQSDTVAPAQTKRDGRKSSEQAENKQKTDSNTTLFYSRDSAEVQLDVGFYAQGQLLAWDAQHWHD